MTYYSLQVYELPISEKHAKQGYSLQNTKATYLSFFGQRLLLILTEVRNKKAQNASSSNYYEKPTWFILYIIPSIHIPLWDGNHQANHASKASNITI